MDIILIKTCLVKSAPIHALAPHIRLFGNSQNGIFQASRITTVDFIPLFMR